MLAKTLANSSFLLTSLKSSVWPHHLLLHTPAEMVSFRTIITSALALAAPIAAQATTAQVVEGLEGLTQKAAALQAPAQSITTVNGPL